MSRAVNVNATIPDVIAFSAKHNALISAIEPLDPTGTRVVFMNAEDAAAITRAYGNRVLKGDVKRMPWKQQSMN